MFESLSGTSLAKQDSVRGQFRCMKNGKCISTYNVTQTKRTALTDPTRNRRYSTLIAVVARTTSSGVNPQVDRCTTPNWKSNVEFLFSLICSRINNNNRELLNRRLYNYIVLASPVVARFYCTTVSRPRILIHPASAIFICCFIRLVQLQI